MTRIAFIATLLFAGAVFAVEPSEMLKDPALEARAREGLLRCVGLAVGAQGKAEFGVVGRILWVEGHRLAEVFNPFGGRGSGESAVD